MKSIECLSVILFVLAPAIQLSAENVTGLTDPAQQGITDQRRGTVTTENQEAKGYMMASHVTGLYSTGNIVSESDESSPRAALVDSQGKANATALPDYLNLPDDDKNGGNNASNASSVREFQPTSTSVFAFPIDINNLLLQNTNAVGPDNGKILTFQSQNGGYVQRIDTMNSEERSGEDIATTVLAINDDQSVTTMKPTDTTTFKEQSYEELATTVPRANNPRSITTMQPIYTDHFEEQSHEGLTTPSSITNDDRSITTMQPIGTNNFEQQSNEDFASTVAGANDDRSITSMQPIDTNNFEERTDEEFVTPVPGNGDNQSVTTMQPTYTNNSENQSGEDFTTTVPGINDDHSITTMQQTDTLNFEHQSEEGFAAPVPGTIGDHSIATIQPIDTINIKEQRDEDFATTVPGCSHEESFTAAVATLPTTLPRNVDTMDQNGASKGTTYKAKQEHEYEEVTKEQYFHFTPSDETSSLVDQGISTAQAPTSSPSLLLTTPGDVENHVQQNGEPQSTPFNAYYDDSTSTPQSEHFLSHTGTENFNAQGHQSSATPIPTVPFKVPDDENDVMKQNDEPNNTKFKTNNDDLSTTRSQDVDLISHSVNNIFKKKEGELSDTSPFSAQDVEATTPLPSKLLTIPGAKEGCMQQNIVSNTTKFEDDYEDIWPTKPQYEDFTPSTATKNAKKEAGEFKITTDSSAHEIGTVATSPTMSIIRSNEASVTQQSGEPTNPISIAYFDAESTTIPNNVNIKPLTDTKSSNEQYEGFSAVTTSAALGVGMTTTPTPIKVPSLGVNPTSHNVEPTSTILDIAYDNTEQTTPEYELVISSTGAKNATEEFDEMSSNMALPPQDNLTPNRSATMRMRVLPDNESDTQLKGESVGVTLQVNQEDNFTITSSPPPFTAPTDNESIKQHTGRPNISPTFKQNEDEPNTTPSSVWLPLPYDDKNLSLLGDISNETKMSFLTIFKILASVNDNLTVMGDSPILTTVLPNYEENFSTTTAIPDIMTTPIFEATNLNETKTQTPSNTEPSPQELLVLYEIHVKMLKVMSITLGTVVALILFKLGCKFLRKRRRDDRTAVPPENAGPKDAAQPSTSHASNTEEPSVSFSDLLAREENE